MSLENVVRQRISEAMDGELAADQFDVAVSDIKSAEAQEAWDVYHRIGDLLRSSDAEVPLSASFSARLSARLEAEPVVFAPVHAARARNLRIRRIALPGALAAAAAAVAFIATPQLMVAIHGGEAMKPVASSVSLEPVPLAVAAKGVRTESGMAGQDIDEYVIAHQRFSPSVYSSTQYARPTAFSNGTTDK